MESIIADLLLGFLSLLIGGVWGTLLWNTKKNKQQERKIAELQKDILQLRKDINLLTEKVMQLEKEIRNV